MNLVRQVSAAASVGLLALVLTACGQSGEEHGGHDPASSAADSGTATQDSEITDPQAHNAADTEFAQMMIVHHEGAIEMADLAVEQAESEEVRTLASGISAAQGPEIAEMTTWLEGWGEDVSPGDAGHGGMDHGGMEMDGLTQEEAMADLGSLSGADFDRRFLELMIEHHRGAIEMAQPEVEGGTNQGAVELAEKVMADQRAEIAEMEQMLADL